jgi:hypothetical protein
MRTHPAKRIVAVCALLTLAACSASGPGREAIADRCVAGGEKPEVCQCFAEESSRRLEKSMFELVVLGAQGRDAEAETRIKALGPERQGAFSTIVRGIIRGCGGEAYLIAG